MKRGTKVNAAWLCSEYKPPFAKFQIEIPFFKLYIALIKVVIVIINIDNLASKIEMIGILQLTILDILNIENSK